MFVKNRKKGYSIVEMLIYLAVFGLVMSFIAVLFRGFFMRDRLEEYNEETVKIKAVSDKAADILRNAAKVIRPATGMVSDKLITLRDDGTYEKFGMYRVKGVSRPIYKQAKTLEALDVHSDIEKEDYVFSRNVTNFYVGRPFYNHALLKAGTARYSTVSALTMELLKLPDQLQTCKYFSDEYRWNFSYKNSVLETMPAFREKYYAIKSGFDQAILTNENINKFLYEFDRQSNAPNFMESKTKLKEFISADKLTDTGKIIFYTAYLINMCSDEISLASKNSRFAVESGVTPATPAEIFGNDVVNGYRELLYRTSRARTGVALTPDYESLIYEIKRVCEFNKNELITQAGIATPYTGDLLDDKGNVINVVNIHFGHTVPTAPSNIDIFSEIENCPSFNSPVSRFNSVYEIINSKLPGLSNDYTLAENLDALFYAVKRIKKVTIFGNKVDIYDHKIKFPVRVSFAGRSYDFAFFVRLACDLALTDFPDFSANTPIPPNLK